MIDQEDGNKPRAEVLMCVTGSINLGTNGSDAKRENGNDTKK